MSYYTSFETSLALREAGAPQDGAERHWYISAVRGGEPRLINPADDLPRNACRAFRLDEILDALEKLGTLEFEHAQPGDSWHVELATENGRPFCCAGEYAKVDGEGTCCWWPTPVETAAACWLAVLRAAREVAR